MTDEVRRLERRAARGDVQAARRLEEIRGPSGWRQVVEAANREAKAIGSVARITASAVRGVFWSAFDRFDPSPAHRYRALPVGLRLLRARPASIVVMAVIHSRAGVDLVTIGAKAIVADSTSGPWGDAGGDWAELPQGPTPWIIGTTGSARGALHGPAVYGWATNDDARDRVILPLEEAGRDLVGAPEGRHGPARLERFWRARRPDVPPC